MKRFNKSDVMRDGRILPSWRCSALTLVLAAGVSGAAEARVMKADFNGDGLEDLVVGVPLNDTGGRRASGAVSVFYGGDNGIPRNPQRSFTQNTPGDGDSPGIAGGAETGDFFGSELAVGDFNRDGVADLVVGVPGEDVDTGRNQKGAGIVHVFYGTPQGLSSHPDLGAEILSEGIGTVGPAAREGDQFGAALP